MIRIIRANIAHIAHIAPLFNKYRIFYGQKSNIEAATDFLKKRISKKESIIFLAYRNEKAVGFIQLYTSYSSVTLQPLYILNDLFVEKDNRSLGIGESLLGRAKVQCTEMRYKGLALETAIDNPAKRLYEKLGWTRDTACFHYFWTSD